MVPGWLSPLRIVTIRRRAVAAISLEQEHIPDADLITLAIIGTSFSNAETRLFREVPANTDVQKRQRTLASSRSSLKHRHLLPRITGWATPKQHLFLSNSKAVPLAAPALTSIYPLKNTNPDSIRIDLKEGGVTEPKVTIVEEGTVRQASIRLGCKLDRTEKSEKRR